MHLAGALSDRTANAAVDCEWRERGATFLKPSSRNLSLSLGSLKGCSTNSFLTAVIVFLRMFLSRTLPHAPHSLSLSMNLLLFLPQGLVKSETFHYDDTFISGINSSHSKKQGPEPARSQEDSNSTTTQKNVFDGVQ